MSDPNPAVRWDDMVSRDALGRATNAEMNLLRQPEHLDVWRETIVALLQRVQERFIDQRNEEVQLRATGRLTRTVMADYSDWRRKKAHYQAALELRANEVKRLLVARDGARPGLVDRVAALETRILALEESVA